MKKFEKSIETLRTELKAAGLEFGGRSSLATLQKLATDNGIDTEEARNTRSIVPNDYKTAYAKNGGNCGDEMAKVMGELATEGGKTSVKRLAEIAEQNGIDFARWGHLNVGQQRMNLSNVLRGKIKKGEGVKIGKHAFKAAA